MLAGQPPSRPRRGISIIELLTVISLIVILIAIILPVLSRVREASRVSVCASNLRQIALAMGAYSMDWGGYPWNEDPLNPGQAVGEQDFPALRACAKHYIVHTGVCQCPSDRDSRAGIGNARQNADASVRASYDVLPAWTLPVTSRVWGGIKDPTQLPVAWDIYGGLSRDRAAALPDSERRPAIRASNHYPRGGNVAYADGHVKWKNAQDWKDINDPGIPDRLRSP